MSPRKQLFESDDFDKKKKLFTSSDFDKVSRSEDVVSHPKPGRNNSQEEATVVEPVFSNSKKWTWIILSIIAVCIVCFFIFSKSRDTAVIEPTQDTEIIDGSLVTIDSVPEPEKATEDNLSTSKKDTSNNADDQNTKAYKAASIADNSNIATPITTSNANVSNDVEAEAMKVIRGDYGLGQERKEKLGAKYQIIQSRVNELKREGIF